jgi:hypothetical protein
MKTSIIIKKYFLLKNHYIKLKNIKMFIRGGYLKVTTCSKRNQFYNITRDTIENDRRLKMEGILRSNKKRVYKIQ